MSRTSASLLCLAALALAAGCGGGAESTGGVASAADRDSIAQNLAPRQVAVARPQARQVSETAEAIGSLTPFVEAAVGADVEGVVTETLVEVGRRVASGDPLADIDRATFELRVAQADSGLAQAQAQAELAAKELARKRQLLEDRTISQATFDTFAAQAKLADAGVGAARAARDLAARDFAKSRLTAPIAGVVAARLVDRGDRVGVGDVLFRIAETARLKLVFALPEGYAGRVGELAAVSFTAAGGGEAREATRWAIAPVVDAASRTVECTFVVDNRHGRVPAGASARVRATFPGATTRWVVPRTALTLEELPRVYEVVDGIARPRIVEVGNVTDTEVEIISGIDASTSVIADAAGIFDGVPVAPPAGS